MRATRRRDTAAELAIRSALHRVGLRFLVDRPLLPNSRSRVDVVFVTARVALFVDGCFWHGCPQHGTLPRETNAHFWSAKIAANQRRDIAQTEELERAGWLVVRVWEHDDPTAVANRIAPVVRGRSRPIRR